MKKILFIAIIMAVLSSCSDEKGEVIGNVSEKRGLPVTISFAGEYFPLPVSTGENLPYAENWEKELKSVTLYAFREWGQECILQRNFTQAEIAAQTVTFLLPSVLPGDLVYFYVVANTSTPKIWYLNQLEGIREMFPELYNGLYEDVTTRAMKSNGFVMSGQKEKNMAPAGQTTVVEITLKRTVAKIKVNVHVTPEFFSKYGGSFSVLGIDILDTPVYTNIVDYNSPLEIETVDLTQNPSEMAGNLYQSLFYVFENGQRSPDERVTLRIRGAYDVDGNSLNRTPQTYVVGLDIDPQGGGVIRRNGYYIIDVNINGVTGGDVEGIIGRKYSVGAHINDLASERIGLKVRTAHWGSPFDRVYNDTEK